ncbi:hypothetical protein KIN20_023998 [Parelaphostrongylus tenuis]|uniref:Uncharacterized protein n=1 Tax=Parelaphostrongylus tenuis TaxID=148309 RepID=A0AAD5QXI8_PARTN|nr:hypothetical protein KIN20_023998 [Parelaphostrongylus tenuis]
MKGRRFSHRNDGELENMSSYVQINIYDTNLKDLQNRGVDIEHMLQHVGFRSVVMDVPILSSSVLKFPVEAAMRRAKSFGGLSIRNRSYSNKDGGRSFLYRDTKMRHKTVQKTVNSDPALAEDSVLIHDCVDMNTTLVTPGIGSRSSHVKKENEDRAAPLTSTPLTSKKFVSFGRFVSGPPPTTSESGVMNFQCAADNRQKEQGDIPQEIGGSFQHEPRRSLSQNVISLNDRLPLGDNTFAGDVAFLQDCQEELASSPGVDSYANATRSSENPDVAAERDISGVQISSAIQLAAPVSPEEGVIEDIGLQSVNPPPLSFFGDDAEQCYNGHKSFADCKLSSPEEQKLHESINKFDDVGHLESEYGILTAAEINKENVYGSEIRHQSYVMEMEDFAEDIDENQMLAHPAPELERQELEESLSSPPFSNEVAAHRNVHLENGVPNEADDDLIAQSRTTERSSSPQRRRPKPNEFDKSGYTCSTAKSKSKKQIFHCHMPNCGKDIMWRPRYGKNRLVDHVRIHWAKEVKQCKLCGFKASSYRKIHHHHRRSHRTMPYVGAVSTETKEDLDELLIYWKQCFPDLPCSPIWSVAVTSM